MTEITSTPLPGAHRPPFGRMASLVRTMAVLIAGVAVMTLAAKTHLPFWPVPMTLHTLAVMAFAVALGPRLATAIFASYLTAGALDLPVFSGTPERGLGLAYMAGPTGGYLLGYLIASGLVGRLARDWGRRWGTPGRTGAMLCGLVPIYGLGLAWLATLLPADLLIAQGLAPFLPGDIAKIALVAAGTLVLPPALDRLRTTIRGSGR